MLFASIHVHAVAMNIIMNTTKNFNSPAARLSRLSFCSFFDPQTRNMTENGTSTDTATVSPSQHEKRDRSNGEESTRRVSQRTNRQGRPSSGGVDNMGAVEESIRQIVVTNLWGTQEEVKTGMIQLSEDTNDIDEAKHTLLQKLFLAHGGHLAVIKAMGSHVNCHVVQEYGIMVLVSASYKNVEMKKAIAAVGGAEAILSAMGHFPTHRPIAFSGLKALSNLCVHPGNVTRFVNVVGGLPIIMDMLVRYKADAETVLWASRLIYKLCTVEELRKEIYAAKIMSALCSAMETHSMNVFVRQSCNGSIKLLADYVGGLTTE